MLNSVNSTTLYESDCLGTSTNVLYDQTCTIPHSVLNDASGYALAQGSVVKVQISATNSYGTSILSDANTDGALVETAPHKP